MVVEDLVRDVAHLPGGDQVLHPDVEQDEAVQGGDAGRPRRRLARGRTRRRPGPRACLPRSAGRRRPRSPPGRPPTRPSRRGRTCLGRAGQRDRQALRRHQALDHEGPQDVVGGQLGRSRRGRFAAGAAAGVAAGRRRLRRSGMSSSLAQASRVAASGTMAVLPWTSPAKTSPVDPSIVIVSPATKPAAADRDDPVGDLHLLCADDGRDPQLTGDDGGVRRRAARGGQDALATAMPWRSSGHVSGRARITSLPGRGSLLGGVRGGHDLAPGHARRCCQARS